jgi:hypothetical protein
MLVPDSADDRYKATVKFYDESGWGYGFKDPYNSLHSSTGYGKSHIDFLEWEVDRGVLETDTGSPWWRAVNHQLTRDMIEAHLLNEQGLGACGGSNEAVDQWLNYINAPSPSAWYSAHNASILLGYQENEDLAYKEDFAEQILMSGVLTRVLFAESMVNDGGVFSTLALPGLSAVDTIVGFQNFYPYSYPLNSGDVSNVMGEFYLENLIFGGNRYRDYADVSGQKVFETSFNTFLNAMARYGEIESRLPYGFGS